MNNYEVSICDPEYDPEAEDDEEFGYDGTPYGCLACGGDYPHCADSCPLFDD